VKSLPLSLRLLVPLLLAAALGGPAAAEDQPDLGASLPLDPALERMSGLPNGLRYWIRPHAMPAGKVSLFLHIASGSLNEEDDQRGLAHFLEHMAFNGSKHFPPGEMVKFFESMGMVFGQHQNAFTSFDQTTYILTLPDTKTETISKGLLFFSDVARELSILKTEVDKERGVIEEEARARSGVNMRMMEKALPLLFPGSRISQRIPIGTMEIIKNAPTQRLRDYYEKWYRPDLSTLLVVGDIDPKAVEPLLKQAFAAWEKPEVAVASVGPGIKPFRGLRADVLSDPEQKNVEASVGYVRKDLPMRTVGDFRRELIERIGRHIMNRRLRTISQENDANYLLAHVQGGQALAGYDMYGFDAQSPVERWQPAFMQVIHEVRRATVHGFGEKELGRARAALLSQLAQMSQAMSSFPSPMVGQHLNGELTRGRKPMSAAQKHDLASRLLPGIMAAEVKAAFCALFQFENAYISLTFPEKDGVPVPTKDVLLAVYQRALAMDVTARKERADVGKLMERDPEPAPVTARAHDDELGISTLTFENGVRVHLKSLPSEKNVNVGVRLYGGVIEEDASTKGLTEAAAVAFSPTRAATKKLRPVDIGQYLAPRQISVGGGQDDISLTLSVAGPPQQIDDALRLAWLLLTEPKVDETALSAWKQQVTLQLKQLATSAPAQAQLALRDLASGGDIRLQVGDLALYEAITPDRAQAWLDRIVRTAPIEVAICGNIDLKEAERLARTWFGSLPARPDRFEEMRALRKVKLVTGPAVKNVTLDSITPMAVVLLGWRGVSLEDSAGQIALMQAGSMLTTRLIETVREEHGLTYSVGAGYQRTDFENLDGMMVQFTADPAKAKKAAKVAKETMLAFLKEGPTAAEIDSTEKQFKNILDEQAQAPGFWMAIMGKLHANSRTFAEIKARLAAIRKVDKEALLKTLREVLTEERFAQVIAAPGAPAAPAGGDK